MSVMVRGVKMINDDFLSHVTDIEINFISETFRESISGALEIDDEFFSFSLNHDSIQVIEAPHGRLIDATAFRKKLNEMFSQDVDKSTLLKVLEELEKMPTIIEAEESK